MNNTYWSDQGKYQAEFKELSDLMPASGKCDTLAGELIRAANKLYYDFNNNGMGNNTSGPINFLQLHNAISKRTYDTIYEYTRGRTYEGNYSGDSFQVAMESMVDQTIKFIIDNPDTLVAENKEDMFDYREDDQQFCECCGDVIEDSWGGMCSYCEDVQY